MRFNEEPEPFRPGYPTSSGEQDLARETGQAQGPHGKVPEHTVRSALAGGDLPPSELSALLARGYLRLQSAQRERAGGLACSPPLARPPHLQICLDVAAQQSDELGGQWALRRP